MSLLSKINKPDEVEEVKDVIYRGKEPLPTGVYPATIKLAFVKESKNGAFGLELHLDIDGKNVREDIYFTNREKDTYYTREKDGEDVNYPLPGYITTNDLSLLSTGEYIDDQETEKKTVDLWDFGAQEELPKEVDMLTSMLEKKIKVGLYMESDYKQKKIEVNGKEKWVDDLEAELTNRNVINKVFSEEGFTVQEAMAELDEPAFITEWEENYTGQVIDKTASKKKKAAKAGPTKSGGAASTGSKPKTGMFNKKK